MTTTTDDLRIQKTNELISPEQLIGDIAVSSKAAQTVANAGGLGIKTARLVERGTRHRKGYFAATSRVCAIIGLLADSRCAHAAIRTRRSWISIVISRKRRIALYGRGR